MKERCACSEGWSHRDSSLNDDDAVGMKRNHFIPPEKNTQPAICNKHIETSHIESAIHV